MSQPVDFPGVSQPTMAEPPGRAGPILYFRACDGDRLELAVLLVRPLSESPPTFQVGEEVVLPETLHRQNGLAVYRYIFSLPATGGAYTCDGESFEVAGVTGRELRLAYVSCNGQEHGDLDRSLHERNVMWQRLVQQHRERPFALLLNGGDQLYADDALNEHPDLQRWAGREVSEGERRLSSNVTERLRDYFLSAYLLLISQSAPAWIMARVPSLCMWDDHDICDGWGSLAEERLDAKIGQEVFRVAREFFLLFQLGCTADNLAPICCDRTGTTLTWAATLPGLTVIAPDLRSERRPNRVLGPSGWNSLEAAVAAAGNDRLFVLSSVPLLGPRLSWIETGMRLFPGLQKFEDDLRDQWQSHAHREEWRRILRLILAQHENGMSVTVISGEIHLATRGTMATACGPLHQLIASGITHPAPTPWYGRILGALARLGEAPLPAHPIRLHPLPGQRRIYSAQRNFLVLERSGNHWSARWELEEDGTTPPLTL